MRSFQKLIWELIVAGTGFCALWSSPGLAQVSPAEIRDPELKQIEQAYLKQLLEVRASIDKMQFPFPFALRRYVGLDPKQQPDADTRGLEFVKFHNRVTLKVSGDYKAAFNADALTDNERANRVLDDLVVPLLRLVTTSFPSPEDFSAYGFEISWHVRRRTHSYDYEGAEIMTLLFDKADALKYLGAPRESERQEILSRSEVYVNGKEFGLALGERDPIPVAEGEHSNASVAPDSDASAPLAASNSDKRLARIYQDPLGNLRKPEAKAPEGQLAVSTDADPGPNSNTAQTTSAKLTQADAEALQKNHQADLDALAREGLSKFHFVDYAAPSFVIIRDRVYLQLTMRNPHTFDRNSTSIYKRAAQSFDLFLAPLLNPLLTKVPKDPEIAGVDITVLNQFDSKPAASSEALELICPLSTLQKFTDSEITNQDLINQSIVLVNGVRIALNLQAVE